jgi:hypothetical protein
MVLDSSRIRNVSDSTQKSFSPEIESLQKLSDFSFIKETRKIEMTYLSINRLVEKYISLQNTHYCKIHVLQQNKTSSTFSKFRMHITSFLHVTSSSITTIILLVLFLINAKTRASLCMNFLNSLSCSAIYTFAYVHEDLYACRSILRRTAYK